MKVCALIPKQWFFITANPGKKKSMDGSDSHVNFIWKSALFPKLVAEKFCQVLRCAVRWVKWSLFSLFRFDTSAEEGGVKVWEPNERGNQSRTQTNFCPGINTLGINPQHTAGVLSSPSIGSVTRPLNSKVNSRTPQGRHNG